MRNINIKLNLSERSEDLIKIAAMQWFFESMPNRNSTFGYHQFMGPCGYPDNFVPRPEYRHLSYEAMVEKIEHFISTMSDTAHKAVQYAEVNTNA